MKKLLIPALAILGACVVSACSCNKDKKAAAKQQPAAGAPMIKDATMATAARVGPDGTIYSAAALRGTDTATGQTIAADAYDVRYPDGSEILRARAIEPAN
ncbi:MAG: hypothetical protein FWD15_05215 [Alphaproteobacteria bacterium]|nr:hypothetical protein [Alphaproteobacteria bacterium]